jgi:regulator of nucleoside diphosphate kinase
VREHPIVVSEADARLLRGLLAVHGEASVRDDEHLHELEVELERASVLDGADVPSDVITLQSRGEVLDLVTGQRNQYRLVLPSDAKVASNRISVLAPLGTALLGYREGDEVSWRMPGGQRRLLIERVCQASATVKRDRVPTRSEDGVATVGAQ